MQEYTKEEKQIISSYFSNTDSNVFALVNLPEVVKGTLFSRYSRTAKSLRRLFLDEFYYGEAKKLFLKEKKRTTNGVDVSKAEDFYERILVGYGDDSVAELGGIHIACEYISNIATKVLENARIGISPLEKSSRYVFYDQKVNGRYSYLRDEKIMKAFGKEYEKTMDLLFDTYSEIVREIFEGLISTIQKPSDVSEIVFKASCRAKACDVARYLLPMSTLTNVGIFANGRSLEYLLIKMGASNLSEIRALKDKIGKEARKVIPAFIKRAQNERGGIYKEYLKGTYKALLSSSLKAKVKNLKQSKLTQEENTVELLEWERNGEKRILSLLIYPFSNLPFSKVLEKIEKFPKKKVEKMLLEITSIRQNRHHKIPRGFEEIYYTFEIESDIGAFRDIHRHRILTQEKQNYSTQLGYTIPKELKNFPKLLQKYVYAMEKADALYKKVYKKLPEEAQYVVPFGYRIRYFMRMNLREAIHLTELRSMSQGHPSYRQIAQKMARLISKVHPATSKYAFKFVDFKDYELERLEAFKKIEAKAKKMGQEVFS